MGSSHWRFITAGIVVLAMGVSACGGSDSDNNSSTAAAAASTSTTASPAASGLDQASIDLALKFTGGKAGKADASLKPVEIGFVNQSGSTPAYPEYLGASKAAEQLINNQLGGIDGHPVKLDTCIIQTEEDGQKCAAQFLANPNIHIADFSLASNGNASFYKTVGGKFPVLVSVAASGADYTTPHVYELDGGGDGVLFALSANAKEQGAKNVAIISSDNPAGKFATGKVLIPQLAKLGIKSKAIYISDTATTPDFASALQAGGAAKADLVVLIPPGAPQCVSTYDAMKQLGIKKNVVTTYSCYGDPMPAHTGGGPAGWNMYGFGTNQRIDNPQTKLFKGSMDAAGQSKDTFVGSTFKTFGDLLAITKWGNDLGFDKISAAGFETQLKAWTGPSFMVPGAIHCGHHPVYVGICGDSAEGSTYKDGKWQSLGPVKSVTLKP
jgi:branched-chain amino acid transport system substrate-binding protein